MPSQRSQVKVGVAASALPPLTSSPFSLESVLFKFRRAPPRPRLEAAFALPELAVVISASKTETKAQAETATTLAHMLSQCHVNNTVALHIEFFYRSNQTSGCLHCLAPSSVIINTPTNGSIELSTSVRSCLLKSPATSKHVYVRIDTCARPKTFARKLQLNKRLRDNLKPQSLSRQWHMYSTFARKLQLNK